MATMLLEVDDGMSARTCLDAAEARDTTCLESETDNYRARRRTAHRNIYIAAGIAGLLFGLVVLVMWSVCRVPGGLASAPPEKVVQLTGQEHDQQRGDAIAGGFAHLRAWLDVDGYEGGLAIAAGRQKNHAHEEDNLHVVFMSTSASTGTWEWSATKLEEGDIPFPGPTVQIRSWGERQEIVGFGGAFTDASATLFSKLNADLQDEVIERYFGKSGLGYNMGRVHINSCDFSTSSYSFDDTENDWDLKNFDTSLKRDSWTLIPLIKRAQAAIHSRYAGKQSLKLLASPWSAPWWMKTGRTMIGSSLRPECQAVWANYIGKWIQAYNDKGIPIWGITVQNEPESSNIFESTKMPAHEQAEFVARHLGPTLKGRHPQVKIFAYDHNKDHLVDYANGVAHGEGGAALKYLDGMAYHWYAGDFFQNVAITKTKFPNLMLLASEATYEKSHFANHDSPSWDWSNGLGYAHDIIGDLNAGSSGWIDWNLILDGTGGPNHVGNVCDAAMIVDIGQQKVHPHPQYYFIGHFSKFFRAGSRSLTTWVDGTAVHWKKRHSYGVCDQSDGLQATSVKNPTGEIAIVVLNCGWDWQEFRIRIDDGKYTMPGKIPPQGIQSFRLHKL